jgi:hypothetical protein
MFKKLMTKNLNILNYISSGLLLFSLILAVEDKLLKNKYFKLLESKKLLEKQVNDLKIDEFKNEITKNKVEYFRNSLEEVKIKIITEFETIKNLEIKTMEEKNILNSHLNNIKIENENLQQLISEILKFYDNNKFLGDNINLFEILRNFINNWSLFISNLSFEQLIAIAHLTSSICILFNILTILSILFGDKLIIYFNLEERFPKFSFIFKLRTKFNNFSLTLSFIMIISILLTLIYVNILIFINFK